MHKSNGKYISVLKYPVQKHTTRLSSSKKFTDLTQDTAWGEVSAGAGHRLPASHRSYPCSTSRHPKPAAGAPGVP